MKRTKTINKTRFRKRTIGLVASIVILAGCEQAEQKVSMFQNYDDCAKQSNASPYLSQQCKDAFKKAQDDAIKTAPKYDSSKECSDEFKECRYSSSNGAWYPLMMGYMMGPGGVSQPLYSNSQGNFVDAAKNDYGRKLNTSRMTTKSSLAPKPVMTKTTTRAGFGSSVGRSSGG